MENEVNNSGSQKDQQAETMKIMNRISEIRNKYPELSKYLNEMPEFPPSMNDSEIGLEDLKKYHNNLLELLQKYHYPESKKNPK